jgi:hypothetical protein
MLKRLDQDLTITGSGPEGSPRNPSVQDGPTGVRCCDVWRRADRVAKDEPNAAEFFGGAE